MGLYIAEIIAVSCKKASNCVPSEERKSSCKLERRTLPCIARVIGCTLGVQCDEQCYYAVNAKLNSMKDVHVLNGWRAGHNSYAFFALTNLSSTELTRELRYSAIPCYMTQHSSKGTSLEQSTFEQSP